MSLLEELKNQRGAVAAQRGINDRAIAELSSHNAVCDAKLADLNRAIAALSPAPAGKGIETDALAEFMKREGAVKHSTDGPIQPNGDLWIEALRRNGECITSRADLVFWGTHYDFERDLDIIAYRVLPSEPAAEESYGEWREGRVIDPRSIAASEQHAEESARAQSLPPLLPPEPPPAATPEQLIEAGAINGEAYGLWRKMAKEPA